MFIRVQVWALVGSLNDIQRLVPKPLLHFLGFLLRVVVLLEGEPLPQFEVLKELSVLCSVHLSLDPDESPAAEKHPHSMMLPPPCFTVGMVQGFLQM
jgi:hypothetical protein